MKHLAIVVVTATSLALAGCADFPGAGAPTVQEGSQQASVERVTIVGLRQVWVQPQNAGTNWGSTVAGAAIGGLLGSKIGKGRGKTVATATGAVVGGSAGNAAGDAMNRVLSWEIIVRRQDGRESLITQPVATGKIPAVGSAARLVSSGWGSDARIIP